jgi:Flp pilus assembly protein TadG
MVRQRNAPDGERGAATTALVLILPVVLLTVMIVVQFALAYHARQVLTAAAQDAAFAATASGASPDAATNTAQHVVDSAGSGLVHDVVIQVSGDTDGVRVEVTATVASVVPGLDLTVSGASAAPTERFRPEHEGP